MITRVRASAGRRRMVPSLFQARHPRQQQVEHDQARAAIGHESESLLGAGRQRCQASHHFDDVPQALAYPLFVVDD